MVISYGADNSNDYQIAIVDDYEIIAIILKNIYYVDEEARIYYEYDNDYDYNYYYN